MQNYQRGISSTTFAFINVKKIEISEPRILMSLLPLTQERRLAFITSANFQRQSTRSAVGPTGPTHDVTHGSHQAAVASLLK